MREIIIISVFVLRCIGYIGMDERIIIISCVLGCVRWYRGYIGMR